MTDSLEDIILNNLVTNEGYARKVLPHIKPEYFEGAYRSAFELVCSFVAKYNTSPNTQALLVEFGKSSFATQQNANDIVKIIHRFESNITVDENWLLDSTELHCKDRAVYLAIMESIAIIDGSNPDKPQTLIPSILSDALGVSFDSHIGHDYILDAQERWEFYNRIENKLPFDIEMLNEITNGGLTLKTLTVLLAGTGVGKSLAMCHIAAQNLSYGEDVLYITLEMSEEKVAERIDANLLDIDIARMKETSNQVFSDKIAKLAAKTNGRLIIKEYPTGGAHAGHFRALLQDLKLKKKFVPRIIIIDYLNICASSRLKGAAAGNTYTLIKSIAEELRGLGVEHNAAILTATQVTRSGFASSDVEITDTSESFGLPATADLFLAFISTEQLEKMGQIMVKQLKNRYNDVSKNKRFTIGLDRSKMRLFNIADPTANIMPDELPATPTPFSIGKSQLKSKNLSALKT